MSESHLDASGIKEQYAAQVAADLEHNTEEQERLAAEAAVLEERLTVLRRDHALLVSMRQTLGGEDVRDPAPQGVGEQGTGEAVKVPKPRAARTDPKPPRRTDTAPEAAAKPTVKAAQPTLVTLVRQYLDQNAEPRSAAEIATALAGTHPDRAIKATVVRTTVEGLVAKGRVQRTKQGASVFYASADSGTAKRVAAAGGGS